jgi:DNA-binding GntR family transcriptional regulator
MGRRRADVTVSRRGSRSLKHQIADQLRAEILNGTLGPGAQLPTEVELMERYSVARNTARDALGILVNEGLVIPRRPRGYFVRELQRMDYRPQSDLRPRPVDAAQDSFLTDQSLAGRSPSQTIDVTITEPPPDVASRLKLPSGELTVARRRVRFLDGEPFHLNDSYYPLTIAQGTAIMSPHDIAAGANQELAAHGHSQVRAVDEILVRMPTPDEVARLDLAPGTPVAYHIITGFGPDGTPLRVVLNVIPGDRHVIIYERPGLPTPDGERK